MSVSREFDMEDTNSASDWSDTHPDMIDTADSGFSLDVEAPIDIEEPLDLVIDESRAPSSTPSPNRAHRMSVSDMIRTLTQPNVGLFPHGVSPKDLFDFMCKLPEDQRASKSRNHLQVLLWRDVKAAKICRLSVGVYTVPEFLEQIAPHYKRRTISPPTSSSTTTMLSDEVVSTMRNVDSLQQAQTRNDAFILHNEPDTPLWSATNGATPQLTKIKRKRKKPPKSVAPVDSTNEISSSTGITSFIKTENEMVSSTTQNGEVPAVNGSPLDGVSMKPKRKRVKKQHSADQVTVFKSECLDKSEICFNCQLTHEENSFGQPERLLCCKDCQFKAHPICLGYNHEMADRCRTYNWQCFDCKLCSVCLSLEENPDSFLLICDSCDKGFHMQCHTPKIEVKPEQDKWICAVCSSELKNQQMQNGNSHKLKLKISPLNNGKRQEQINSTVNSIVGVDCNTKLTCSLLDEYGLPSMADDPIIKRAAVEANTWSVDQVFQFISDLGFPEQAVAFKREEIDGQALLLLKRSDVLSMLSLKLGPALKIHRRLSTMQTQALEGFTVENGLVAN